MTESSSPDRARAVRLRRAAEHAAVWLLFCALTVVMVFPLAADPFEQTAGWEGDNAFCIRQFWWMKHALVDLRGSPFFDASTYYPVGHDTVNGELFPATTIPGIPLTILWGPVFAYNVTLLFTFAMTGFGTYLWIRRLTGSLAAGIVAGVVAAFLPYRFAHLPGHLHMVSTHWVPWSLYAFDRFLERKSLARGAGLGAFVALVALSSWYYAYAIGLMLPVYALARARPWREQRVADWWRGVLAAGVTAGLMVAPFLVPYLRLRARGGLTRGIAEMESWSINFYDFFLPNRLNPAWSAFVLEWFPKQGAQWVERGVALGYTALALALVAFLWRRRSPAIAALLVVWGVSFVIALGPTLHLGDRQVLIPVPLLVSALATKLVSLAPSLASVADEIAARQALAIPLPSFFLYLLVPMTSGMRVMSRFGMWTGLMTAGLAGFGIALWQERLGRGVRSPRGLAVVLVVIVSTLVLAESRSRIVTTPLRPREVDVWLSRQPRAAVAELPLEQGFRPVQDYYKTVHQQPTVFGPIGDGFFPALLERRKAQLQGFPSEDSLQALRSWGVRYLIFTKANIPDWAGLESALASAPGVRFSQDIDGVAVYLLDPAPASPASARW